MTAQSLAELLAARRSGRGRWMARCPAHDDRSPSLSIAEGQKGTVLVRCWAGCELSAVLKALGLTMRELFQGEPLSPQQVALLAREREAKAEQRRGEREIERQAYDHVRRWESIVNALGAKLARLPDDSPEGDELTRLFHRACEKLQAAELDAKTERPAANGPHERIA